MDECGEVKLAPCDFGRILAGMDAEERYNF
jgi:hypothetical protein